MRYPILVIGDMILDVYVKGTVERISPEAPIPILNKIGDEKFVPGGACNVAMNIRASGKDTDIIGLVGKDPYGKKLLSLLQKENINNMNVFVQDIKTTTKIRFLSDRNQQLLRMDIENVKAMVESLDLEEIIEIIKRKISGYSIIVISDYCKGFLTNVLTQAIIFEARKNGIKVLIDVKSSNYKKYLGAWLLKPNRNELKAITKMPADTDEEIISASRYLLSECNSEYVLTTCGDKGMVLVNRDTANKMNTVGKDVYDVTGAGDTVIAYLASGLVEGKSVIESMEMANYAAGIQVGKVGTSQVYIKEVREAMGGFCASYLKKKLSRDNLDEYKARAKGKKIVFTNGCFDILHIGHKRYLEEARKLGDILVVGVNSDNSVKRLKGEKRPINSELDRLELLTALDCVDYVILFEEDTPLDLIKMIKPNVLVKGGDYKLEEVIGKDIVESYDGEVIIMPLIPGKSTSSVIDRIKEYS